MILMDRHWVKVFLFFYVIGYWLKKLEKFLG